jgi:hypothetical protein
VQEALRSASSARVKVRRLWIPPQRGGGVRVAAALVVFAAPGLGARRPRRQ